MASVQSIELSQLVEKMNLKSVTPNIDMTGRKLTTPEINRPALQLTGYFDHFASERVQIVGYVEYTYLQSRTHEEKYPIYERFFPVIFPVSYTLRRRSRRRRPWSWRKSIRFLFL